MTKTRRFVRFFSFFLTLTLVFVSFSTPAYAMTNQQFSAWIAAAIQAINITVSSTMIPVADFGQKLNEFLSYPVKVESTQIVDIPYTFDYTDLQEELNKSVIQIDKDTVTIDGVKYTDIWLSNDAAEKFRVNAFDLENAFDITSHSEGTFVEGVGTISGIPIYNVNDELRSQNYSFAFPSEFGVINNVKVGNITNEAKITKDSGDWFKYNWNNSILGLSNNRNELQSKVYVSKYLTDYYNYVLNPHNNSINRMNKIAGSFIDEPFDFNWVSGTIPADEQLLPEEGLRIRVPTDSINQWYTDNPSMGPNVTINMGDPELSNKIDDLIDLIIPIIPMLDIDFTTPGEPAPQPEPIPEPEPYPDPLPDPDISIIDSTLKDIIQALKNIFDNISIGNSITTAIKNLADKIKWALDDIKESIGDLIEKIVRGNIDWFSDIIDSIKLPFLPWLNIFRLATNIWHYVTSWVASITEPLTYFMQVMYDVNPNLVKPFYAVAAAAIVIAIYKRFGQ